MKKHTKKTRWGRVALVWLAALGCVFYLVPREDLPKIIKNNPVVVKAYSIKGGADRNAANIEPAAGGAGYKADDRRELDSLIGRGGYNQ